MEPNLKTAKSISRWLDNQFNFLGFKFGLDPILGLIPGIGDIISLVLAGYILMVGQRMKVSQDDMNRMVANIVLDFILGTVPLVGDLGDFVFKANERNIKILEKYEKQEIIEEGEVVS